MRKLAFTILAAGAALVWSSGSQTMAQLPGVPGGGAIDVPNVAPGVQGNPGNRGNRGPDANRGPQGNRGPRVQDALPDNVVPQTDRGPQMNRGDRDNRPGDYRPGDRRDGNWQGNRPYDGRPDGRYDNWYDNRNRGYGYSPWNRGNWYPNSQYPYYGNRNRGGYWNSWSVLPWIGGAYLGGRIGQGVGGFGPGYGTGYYGYYGYDTPQRYNVARPTDSGEVVQQQDVAQQQDRTTTEGQEYEQMATQAFRQGDYSQAARYATHGLIEMPQNGQLQLLAAQALFALGDYGGSASLLHQAASILDENQWGSIITNYKSYYRGNDYVQQMRQLDEYLSQNQEDSAAFFVRGYNYGFLNHEDAAVKDLTRAYELEPRDKLAAALIQRFGGEVPEVSTPQEGQAQPGAEQQQPENTTEPPAQEEATDRQDQQGQNRPNSEASGNIPSEQPTNELPEPTETPQP